MVFYHSPLGDAFIGDSDHTKRGENGGHLKVQANRENREPILKPRAHPRTIEP